MAGVLINSVTMIRDSECINTFECNDVNYVPKQLTWHRLMDIVNPIFVSLACRLGVEMKFKSRHNFPPKLSLRLCFVWRWTDW